MSEKQMFALLTQIWGDLQHAQFLWVALGLALILAFSAWFSYRLRGQEHKYQQSGQSALRSFGIGSLKRIAFPLVALIFVLILRKILVALHWEHLSLLYLAGPLLITWALVRILVYVLRCVFSEGGFLITFERVITSAIWGWMVLGITGLDDPVIKLFEQVSFGFGKQTINLWMLLHGAVTVGITLLIALWAASLIESRLMSAEHLDANVRVVVGRLAKAILLVIALLSSLSLVGIDVTTLSVFSGALAVGLGLGLQRIASNYVSGFIILLDRSIRLGNLVTIDDRTSGTVTQITTRYTVLRTLTGTEVIIPNEFLVNNIVQNQSFTDTRVRVAVAIQVAYRTDLDQAMRLMAAAARQQPRVLVEPAPGVLLTDFADSGINLELGFWVADPEDGTANTRSVINLAIWKSFREHSIEIPYPQREVRIIGEAPALA